ncbi:MAG: T9SS type A sorting domain-containing protein [Saprospiraceae bacterium]
MDFCLFIQIYLIFPYLKRTYKISDTLKLRLTLFLFSLPFGLWGQSSDWDSDKDAMPDSWEFNRQLDVNDPKDAWLDPDADGICNLFEYMLGSDPQDPAQPKIVKYLGLEPLNDFIEKANRGVVLQIPEGTYLLNYNHKSFIEAPRVLIQGGWNRDFTARNHCLYPTILDGGGQGAIFDYLLASGNSSTLILDGLQLQHASSGAIQYKSYLAKAQLVVANCTVRNNDVHPAAAVLSFEDGAATLIADFIIVNTLIVANTGTGISAKQHANRANFKVLHSLVAFNDYAINDGPPYLSGFGLRFQPASDSTIQIQFANTIFWENKQADVSFRQVTAGAVAVDSRHNIYGYFAEDTEALFFNNPSDRSIDPLLEQDDKLRFFLAANSPAIRAGIDIGFTNTINPDIGPITCVNALTSIAERQPKQEKDYFLFPNPVGELLTIEKNFSRPTALQLVIYDQYGRPLKYLDFGQQAAGEHQFLVDTKAWPAGLYYLHFQTDWGNGGNAKVIKIKPL